MDPELLLFNYILEKMWDKITKEVEQPTMLTKTLTDAYLLTCSHSAQEVADIMTKTTDDASILFYQKMDRNSMWLNCAEQLTILMHQNIEFAKMVPGFMALTQDDQLMLIKAGNFEMCVVRMSRYIDLTTSHVVYDGKMLPAETFFVKHMDHLERKVVSYTFELARSIAELKLSDSEIALYSAIVLLSADRPGLDAVIEVQRLNKVFKNALKGELTRSHKLMHNGSNVLDLLVATLENLQELGMMHMVSLAKFQRSFPHLVFPRLHREIFRTDG